MTGRETALALLCGASALCLLAVAPDLPAKDTMKQAPDCSGHLASVISGAGFSSSHPEFFTAGTFGQPTPVGIARVSGLVLYAGFMPPYIVDYFCSVGDPGPVHCLMINTYPNPFASSTRIEYSLACEAAVNITVYDVGGRKVRNLAAATKPAGTHSSHWDGRDSRGAAVSPGVYWCVLKAGRSEMKIKMVVIR